MCLISPPPEKKTSGRPWFECVCIWIIRKRHNIKYSEQKTQRRVIFWSQNQTKCTRKYSNYLTKTIFKTKKIACRFKPFTIRDELQRLERNKKLCEILIFHPPIITSTDISIIVITATSVIIVIRCGTD